MLGTAFECSVARVVKPTRSRDVASANVDDLDHKMTPVCVVHHNAQNCPWVASTLLKVMTVVNGSSGNMLRQRED